MNFELDWLKKWNLFSPNNIAIQDGETGREYSYRQLFEAACSGASFLKEKYGVKRGDRIALLATNELESVFLFFALHRLGATLVPINFRLTKREVDHILGDSNPSLLIVQEAFLHFVSDKAQPHLLLQGGPSCIDGATSVAEVGSPKVAQTPISFADAVARPFSTANAFTEFHSSEDTSALILYTSGTTGAPKGAMISHQMIFWNSINATLRLNISQSDSTVIFLPFFHTGGWNVLTTPFLHRGAKVIFLKKFDGEQILRLSAEQKCTLLFGVPTTMDMMARLPLFEKYDLSSIRYAIVGGEPMPLDLIKVWDRKGIPVRQGYGLTEFGPAVFSLNEEDALRKIGSIGFPNFYVEAKVVDENGKELPANEIGELILRGPMCMTGYWNNPKATGETIRNGWLYTGDLVRHDSEGYFYVVGRKKDMYISGAENVYPPEIEQVLRQVPQIREVAVIGIPDETWGEVGKAFIVKDQEITIEEIQAHCLENLAKYKIPKHFVFVPDLPKGDSGKILKRLLQTTVN